MDWPFGERTLPSAFTVIVVGWLLIAGIPVVAGGPAVEQQTEPGATVAVYQLDGRPAGASEITRAIAAGEVTRGGRLAVGDRFVVAIAAPSVSARVESHAGPPTDRFFAAFSDDAVWLEQENPTVQIEPKHVTLGPANTTVYRDGPRTYLVVNTSALDVRRGDRLVSLDPGDAFTVDFDPAAVAGGRSGQVTLFPAPVSFTDNRWYRPLAPERVRLPIALSVPPDEQARLRFETANRTLTANLSGTAPQPAFDLRSVRPGTNYTLTLFHDGEVIERRTGRIRPPEATIRNVTVDRTDGELLVNLTARLSHGGAITVRDDIGQLLEAREFRPDRLTADTVNQTVRLSIRIRDPTTDTIQIQARRYDGAGPTLYPNATRRVPVPTANESAVHPPVDATHRPVASTR